MRICSLPEDALQADQEWVSIADYMLWKVFQFPTHQNLGGMTG